MGLTRKLVMSAAALALMTGVASAASVTISVHDASGDGSDQVNNPNRADVYANNYGAFTPSGASWDSGVGVIDPPNMDPTGGDKANEYRSPWSGTGLVDVNDYFAAGPNFDSTLPNPARLVYILPQSSIHFLWGSIDGYNSLTFGGLSGGAADVVLSGAQVRDAVNTWSTSNLDRNVCGTGATGNFACTALLTFTMTEHTFQYVEFFSEGAQAYEFAMAPIPLPAPALLLLTGIGALGGLSMTRRRRERDA